MQTDLLLLRGWRHLYHGLGRLFLWPLEIAGGKLFDHRLMCAGIQIQSLGRNACAKEKCTAKNSPRRSYQRVLSVKTPEAPASVTVFPCMLETLHSPACSPSLTVYVTP